MKRIWLLSLVLLTIVSGCKKNEEFLGFKIGQEIDVRDADERTVYDLGKPKEVMFGECGYRYWKCQVKAKDEVFDKVYVCVSEDKKVVSICGERNFRCLSDAVICADELWRGIKELHGDDLQEVPCDDDGVGHCGEIKSSGNGYMQFMDEDQCLLQHAKMSGEFAKMMVLESQAVLKRKVKEVQARKAAKASDDAEKVEEVVEDALHELDLYYIAWDEENTLGYRKVMNVLRDGFAEIKTDDDSVKKQMRLVRQSFEDVREDVNADIAWMRKVFAGFKRDIETGKATNVQLKGEVDKAQSGMKSRREKRKQYILMKLEGN